MLAQNTVGTESNAGLAALMMFTTDTFPGQSAARVSSRMSASCVGRK
jgi:hypothetical protein